MCDLALFANTTPTVVPKEEKRERERERKEERGVMNVYKGGCGS